MNWPALPETIAVNTNDATLAGYHPLPPSSVAKVEALVNRRADAHAAWNAAHDDMMEASRILGLARNRRGYAEHGELSVGRLHNADAERLDAEVARAKAAHDKAKERVEQASKNNEKFAFIGRALNWLDEIRYARQALKAVTAPKVNAGDYRKAVDRLRAEIIALEEQWQAAEAAPRPIAVAKSALNADIDRIALQGEPRVEMRRRSGPPVSLIEDKFRLAIWQGNAEAGTTNKLIGDGGARFLIWLLRDEIKSKLFAMIGDEDAPDALSDDEREARFEKIQARRLDLERLEEATIVAGEDAGMFIPRRPDADPRAVLEVVEA